MLRFIVKETDYGPTAGAGEEAIVEFKTIDVDVPELERLLIKDSRSFVRAILVGVEKL